jgi:Dynamin central region
MPLSLGYVGVIGRASKDPSRIRQYLERELDVLQHHGYLDNDSIEVGTVSLRNRICKQLIHEAMDQLPAVLEAVERKIQGAASEHSLLGDLSGEEDLEFVSHIMEEIILKVLSE